MQNWIDIGPDIEVEAAKWDAEQAAQAEIQGEELNSCDALRIIDGVSMVQINE